MRSLAENGAEAAAEVRWGEVGHRRDGTDIERLSVVAVHRIAGAEQAPIKILNFLRGRGWMSPRGGDATAHNARPVLRLFGLSR